MAAPNDLGWRNNGAPTPPPGAAPPAAAPGGPGGLWRNTSQSPGGWRNKTGSANSAVSAIQSQTPHTPGLPTYQAPQPQGGSQSGPGIMEQWFNQRASGTDPGWEYGMGRATDSINKQFAARGGYNSSGAMQSLGDMYANAQSQREGQLDTLAGGASSEHRGRQNDMFSQGMGLAQGQAGTAGAYDQAQGSAQSQQLANQLMLQLTKSGVDQATAQAQVNAILGLGKSTASVVGGKGT